MAVFFWFAFPALAVCVVASLYPERVTRPFAGSGRRRFTMQSAKEAGETIRTLEMQLAEAQRPKACPNCHHVAGWPTGAELVDSDRSDPAPHIHAPAPVDNGCRDTPRANADTQPVDVRDLRAALGEDDTVTLPAVTTVTPVVALDDTQMLVTWGTELPAKTKTAVEDWATGTAPGPMHEVPVGLGAKASIQVATALDEAS